MMRRAATLLEVLVVLTMLAVMALSVPLAVRARPNAPPARGTTPIDSACRFAQRRHHDVTITYQASGGAIHAATCRPDGITIAESSAVGPAPRDGAP
ncbi:MAG: hypothetical protein MUE41_09415 [Gemmatimonadaceae bacterium]|jgi:hypothetical protein|nr:hypothetical protein [Gemmatimonadaceae bacterium]